MGTYTRRVHDHEANHAAVSARLPGAETAREPELGVVPREGVEAIITPTPQKIQPMALRGWREAMMAPTTEKVRA